MAHYAIIEQISKGDISKYVLKHSHYTAKNQHLKRFVCELQENGRARRNIRAISQRFSKIGINLYFLAWIDKTTDKLYMKLVTSGSGWPKYTFPRGVVMND